MDFGKFLIGAIGYGFAIFLLLGVLAALRDVGRSKKGVLGIGTPDENMEMVVCGIIAAFVVALITRLTLGAI